MFYYFQNVLQFQKCFTVLQIILGIQKCFMILQNILEFSKMFWKSWLIRVRLTWASNGQTGQTKEQSTYPRVMSSCSLVFSGWSIYVSLFCMNDLIGKQIDVLLGSRSWFVEFLSLQQYQSKQGSGYCCLALSLCEQIQAVITTKQLPAGSCFSFGSCCLLDVQQYCQWLDPTTQSSLCYPEGT